MALTYIARKELYPDHQLVAFIVDHRLRPESTEEVLQVQRNLNQLDPGKTPDLHTRCVAHSE
jgi:tRNA(Ile)-lysidine synthase TilS/MesJ